MLKIIKLKEKRLELTKDKDEIKTISIEIYGLLLGYFSRKKDKSFIHNNNEILDILEERIKYILNTNYRILNVKDNSKDSFTIFINNVNNKENNKLCIKLSENFTLGYDYYDYYNNNSLFDYIILHKQERLENKLIKHIKK